MQKPKTSLEKLVHELLPYTRSLSWECIETLSELAMTSMTLMESSSTTLRKMSAQLHQFLSELYAQAQAGKYLKEPPALCRTLRTPQFCSRKTESKRKHLAIKNLRSAESQWATINTDVNT